MELVTWDPWTFWTAPESCWCPSEGLQPPTFKLWPPMSKETQEWKTRVWRAQTSAILRKKWQLTKGFQQTFVPKNFLGATQPKSSRSVAGGPWALQLMDRNVSRGLPSLCTKENTAKKVTKIMRIWSNWSSDTLPLGAYNHSGRLSGNTNKMSYIPAVRSSNSTPNINLEKPRPMCSKTKKEYALLLCSYHELYAVPKVENDSNAHQQENGYTNLV